MKPFFARWSRQHDATAEGALASARQQHDARVKAIQDGIGTAITAAAPCSHNVRPSCGKCQYRAGLAKALEIAREAAGAS